MSGELKIRGDLLNLVRDFQHTNHIDSTTEALDVILTWVFKDENLVKLQDDTDNELVKGFFDGLNEEA